MHERVPARPSAGERVATPPKRAAYTDEHEVQDCFRAAQAFLRFPTRPPSSAILAPSVDNLLRDLDNLILPEDGAERRHRRRLIARLNVLCDALPG